ncbi:hypothetical protein [Streptomyces sp. bgisy154]|uniref:hypothetical protein n=1 Tax=Streptomyces sp. bgisy154 TaxID=3413794 RepID=UPI003D73E471
MEPRGRVLTGVADGRIPRVDGPDAPPSARVECVAEIGGRPLGPDLCPDGEFLVRDGHGGLPAVDPNSPVRRRYAGARP